MSGRNRRAARANKAARSWGMTALLVGACAISLYPFAVMLFGSLKKAGEITTNPGGVPDEPTISNFRELLFGAQSATVWRGLLNSVIVVVPATCLTVVLAGMAGYAFARFNFRGKNVLFGMLIASMLVPLEVNIPTLYLMFSKVGWLNSYQALILPGSASVLYMFMARQYMAGLPEAVFDAARVDGAGHARTFVQVALPMSRPVLGAIAVLSFVAKWSEYVWPRIANNDPDFQTIMVLLPSISMSQAGSFLIRPEALMAGAVLVTVPLVVVFLMFQDKIMNGVTAGGVRE
jgi:ABC-type glycerol-3-phosphate transport system permease component